jgi:hypothetical protein
MLPQKRNRALEGQALWLVVMASLSADRPFPSALVHPAI